MLHELLVALRGHSGYIFCEKGGSFSVNSSLPFFHPCEVAIINELLKVASDYKILCEFISTHVSCGAAGAGMYLEAVCQGLDMVLDPYRDTVTKLERDMLESCDTLPLSLVQHRLLPHKPVLRSLVLLVSKLQKEQPVGVMVLDMVYKASSSGVAGVGAALRQVLAEGHKVLYKQLLAWLLQGALYDPHGEFFIVKEEGEESLLVGEEGDTSRSKSGRYKLVYDLVPSHISHRLAEKIYFIGESIQLFESDKRVEVQGAVLKEREAEFYQALTKLRDREEFVVAEFGQFVDRIRESVSSHLHHLVVVESGLVGELRIVWDMFTMARGELFHAFINLSDNRLSLPPTGATQHDVSQAWLSAIMSHTETDENMMGRVTVVVGRDTSRIGWDQVSLQYAVPWPLHLVVTPAALEKYNTIFSFLLLVRRTQAALHKLWAEAMFKSRGARRREDKDVLDTVAQTRQHMTFLVDNLQYYLMADVLDTQVSALTTKLATSASFEDVRNFHDQFLSQVQASIFLHNAPVNKCLVNTLSVCLQFCSSSNPDTVSSICTSFSRHSSLLLQLLTSLRHQLAPTNLAQLLTRIDYNRFFSKKEKVQTKGKIEDNKEES